MGVIEHNLNKDDALFIVKNAISGKFAILKEKDYELKVGAPMMTATILIEDKTISISGSGTGKTVANTCESAIKQELEKEKRQNKNVEESSNNLTNKNICVDISSEDAYLERELKFTKLLKDYHELFEKGIIIKDLYEYKKMEIIKKMMNLDH